MCILIAVNEDHIRRSVTEMAEQRRRDGNWLPEAVIETALVYWLTAVLDHLCRDAVEWTKDGRTLMLLDEWERAMRKAREEERA